MAIVVTGVTASDAWLVAARTLLEGKKREAVNLCIEATRPCEETPSIKKAVDGQLLRRRTNGKLKPWATDTVANTIFPEGLYWPARGREGLYEAYLQTIPVLRRVADNRHGTYFARMINYPSPDGAPVNQLERAVERLCAARGREPQVRSQNNTEMALSDPGCDADIRIFSPAHDQSIMGFPCMSHISLTLSAGQVHLTALYRNQYLLEKAYGNLVGLGRLMRFISLETGWEPGTLMCIATHMKVDCSRQCLGELVVACGG